jgi:hypothetical protein
LTSIDGVSEDEAIEIHDAAEQVLAARGDELPADESEPSESEVDGGGTTQPDAPATTDGSNG